MNAAKDEIEARLEAARNHKRATCGVGIVVLDVLGDVSDYAVTAARIAELKRRKRNPDALTAEEKRDRKRGYERKYRVIRCSATKRRTAALASACRSLSSGRKARYGSNRSERQANTVRNRRGEAHQGGGSYCVWSGYRNDCKNRRLDSRNSVDRVRKLQDRHHSPRQSRRPHPARARRGAGILAVPSAIR